MAGCAEKANFQSHSMSEQNHYCLRIFQSQLEAKQKISNDFPTAKPL